MKYSKEIITSRNNALIKWASSLSDKKYRNIEKSFIIEGEKLCYEAMEAGLVPTHIFISEDKLEKNLERLKVYSQNEKFENCTVISVSESVFEKISTEKSPQGIISVLKYLDFFNNIDIIYKEEFLLDANEKALMLYSVRDPGNLGAIIRSAVAFGISRVILSDDCADVYNSRTVRGAMGSLFKIKITTVKDFGAAVGAIRESGRRVYAAELSDGAVSIDAVGLLPTDLFIIGNEGHGIDKEISSLATGSVYIPIRPETESLNASVAASIFAWEIGKL
jgi:TrmH family RNA methyltransferase